MDRRDKPYYYLSQADLEYDNKKYASTHLQQAGTEKEIARFLIDILCQTKGKQTLRSIVESQCRNLAYFNIKTKEDLREFLEKYPQCFVVRESSEGGADDNGLEVEVTAAVTICPRHVQRYGSCPDDGECGRLHVCKFFMLTSKCEFNICHYGHKLLTDHNITVLKRHLLDHLSICDLSMLMKRRSARTQCTRPMICRFYNYIGGCSKGVNCNALHICKRFILGDCKFGDTCYRNHDLLDSSVIFILEQYAVDVEDLSELMWDNEKPCKVVSNNKKLPKESIADDSSQKNVHNLYSKRRGHMISEKQSNISAGEDLKTEEDLGNAVLLNPFNYMTPLDPGLHSKPRCSSETLGSTAQTTGSFVFAGSGYLPPVSSSVSTVALGEISSLGAPAFVTGTARQVKRAKEDRLVHALQESCQSASTALGQSLYRPVASVPPQVHVNTENGNRSEPGASVPSGGKIKEMGKSVKTKEENPNKPSPAKVCGRDSVNKPSTSTGVVETTESLKSIISNLISDMQKLHNTNDAAIGPESHFVSYLSGLVDPLKAGEKLEVAENEYECKEDTKELEVVKKSPEKLRYLSEGEITDSDTDDDKAKGTATSPVVVSSSYTLSPIVISSSTSMEKGAAASQEKVAFDYLHSKSSDPVVVIESSDIPSSEYVAENPIGYPQTCMTSNSLVNDLEKKIKKHKHSHRMKSGRYKSSGPGRKHSMGEKQNLGVDGKTINITGEDLELIESSEDNLSDISLDSEINAGITNSFIEVNSGVVVAGSDMSLSSDINPGKAMFIEVNSAGTSQHSLQLNQSHHSLPRNEEFSSLSHDSLQTYGFASQNSPNRWQSVNSTLHHINHSLHINQAPDYTSQQGLNKDQAASRGQQDTAYCNQNKPASASQHVFRDTEHFADYDIRTSQSFASIQKQRKSQALNFSFHEISSGVEVWKQGHLFSAGYNSNSAVPVTRDVQSENVKSVLVKDRSESLKLRGSSPSQPRERSPMKEMITIAGVQDRKRDVSADRHSSLSRVHDFRKISPLSSTKTDRTDQSSPAQRKSNHGPRRSSPARQFQSSYGRPEDHLRKSRSPQKVSSHKQSLGCRISRAGERSSKLDVKHRSDERSESRQSERCRPAEASSGSERSRNGERHEITRFKPIDKPFQVRDEMPSKMHPEYLTRSTERLYQEDNKSQRSVEWSSRPDVGSNPNDAACRFDKFSRSRPDHRSRHEDRSRYDKEALATRDERSRLNERTRDDGKGIGRWGWAESSPRHSEHGQHERSASPRDAQGRHDGIQDDGRHRARRHSSSPQRKSYRVYESVRNAFPSLRQSPPVRDQNSPPFVHHKRSCSPPGRLNHFSTHISEQPSHMHEESPDKLKSRCLERMPQMYNLDGLDVHEERFRESSPRNAFNQNRDDYFEKNRPNESVMEPSVEHGMPLEDFEWECREKLTTRSSVRSRLGPSPVRVEEQNMFGAHGLEEFDNKVECEGRERFAETSKLNRYGRFASYHEWKKWTIRKEEAGTSDKEIMLKYGSSQSEDEDLSGRRFDSPVVRGEELLREYAVSFSRDELVEDNIPFDVEEPFIPRGNYRTERHFSSDQRVRKEKGLRERGVKRQHSPHWVDSHVSSRLQDDSSFQQESDGMLLRESIDDMLDEARRGGRQPVKKGKSFSSTWKFNEDFTKTHRVRSLDKNKDSGFKWEKSFSHQSERDQGRDSSQIIVTRKDNFDELEREESYDTEERWHRSGDSYGMEKCQEFSSESFDAREKLQTRLGYREQRQPNGRKPVRERLGQVRNLEVSEEPTHLNFEDKDAEPPNYNYEGAGNGDELEWPPEDMEPQPLGDYDEVREHSDGENYFGGIEMDKGKAEQSYRGSYRGRSRGYRGPLKFGFLRGRGQRRPFGRGRGRGRGQFKPQVDSDLRNVLKNRTRSKTLLKAQTEGLQIRVNQQTVTPKSQQKGKYEDTSGREVLMNVEDY